MSDPFLEREKELMKLNESLNTKMTFDLKQPKASVSSRTKRVSGTVAAAAAATTATTKLLKYDQINHAKPCTKATSKSKTDSCEIIKKPISTGHSVTAVELEAKDIGFNRTSSGNFSSISNKNRSTHKTMDDTHTTCNADIKQTMMGVGGDMTRDDGCANQQQYNSVNIDHAPIEKTIEKAIDTTMAMTKTTAAAHLNLIPANVYRKNITTDGIIK